MECLDTRIQSFAKSRRIKSRVTGKLVSLKWPHPSSSFANPNMLAEAGFYYDPSPEYRDSVTCFMCSKELSNWEKGDDPFAIHLEKARGTCAWALVRCYLDVDGEPPDPSMLPSSRMMEKARLETFSSSWPHDAVRGHGANSKRMAKAGFAYTPQSPGDDTASCFYCGVALSGWDSDDDPLEEHRKREAKSGQSCRFLSSISSSTAARRSPPVASTSRSKAAHRPPSRTSSRKKLEVVTDEDDGGSTDDLISVDGEDASKEVNGHTSRSSRITRSTGNRASTIPAKTPGSSSQKSGRSVRGRTPVTGLDRRTAAATVSHVEEEGEGEGEGEVYGSEREQETGKKVSRSKSKRALTNSKSKGRIEAIEEEEEEAPASDIHKGVAQGDEQTEDVVEKPKRRGRPPGSGKRQKEKLAATTSKTKEKKTPAPVEESQLVQDSDIEEIPPPKLKVKHTHKRTRTKHDSESPISIPSTSRPQIQPKPSSTTKKPHPTMEVEVVLPSLPPSTKSDGAKSKGKSKQQNWEEEAFVRPADIKAKQKVSRPKPKLIFGGVDSEGEDDAEPVETATKERLGDNNRTRHPHDDVTVEIAGLKRKSSATSDDAGYATAVAEEHHINVNMDHADRHTADSLPSEPPTKKLAVGPDSEVKVNGAARRISPNVVPEVSQQSLPRSQSHSQLSSQSRMQQSRHSARQQHTGPSQPTARISSRTVARAPSRSGNINDNDVVDISSDDESVLPTPPLPPEEVVIKGKAQHLSSRTPVIEVDEGVKGAEREEKVYDIVDRNEGPTSIRSSQAEAKRIPTTQSSVPMSRSPQHAIASAPGLPLTGRPREAPEMESDVEMTDVQVRLNETNTTHHEHPPKPTERAPSDVVDEASIATPPPHTPSVSPRNSRSPRIPAQLMQSFDEDTGSGSNHDSFTPFLSLAPLGKFSSLTEEESEMTVEQFIRHEIELQYRQFKEDGERQIAQFREQAAETRRTIEAA